MNAEIVRRWSDSHRYRSEEALRLFLRRANLGREGKFIRESSRLIVNAVIIMVMGMIRVCIGSPKEAP